MSHATVASARRPGLSPRAGRRHHHRLARCTRPTSTGARGRSTLSLCVYVIFFYFIYSNTLKNNIFKVLHVYIYTPLKNAILENILLMTWHVTIARMLTAMWRRTDYFVDNLLTILRVRLHDCYNACNVINKYTILPTTAIRGRSAILFEKQLLSKYFSK